MAEESVRDATFGLLFNGLDFIVSALEHLQGDPSPRAMKYGVLHLSAGTALVLKERLRREGDRLIFQDPSKFSLEAFRSGNFKSVALDRCIERLGERGVLVPKAPVIAMTALSKDRNKLEHFGARIGLDVLSAPTATTLSFVIDFVAAELESEIGSEEAMLLARIREGLPRFGHLVEQRLAEKKAILEGPRTRRTCPTCAQDTLMLGDNAAECAFCTTRMDPEPAADEYITAVLHVWDFRPHRGDVWPRRKCPDCDSDTLVVETAGYVCFSCGEVYGPGDLTECVSCGDLFASDGETAVCGACFEAAAERDD